MCLEFMDGIVRMKSKKTKERMERSKKKSVNTGSLFSFLLRNKKNVLKKSRAKILLTLFIER